MPSMSVSSLKRGGLVLLVAVSALVGCSWRTAGTGVIDEGSGGNALGVPTTSAGIAASASAAAAASASGASAEVDLQSEIRELEDSVPH
jgi:hypothetical protein